jgi:hypothetical protein
MEVIMHRRKGFTPLEIKIPYCESGRFLTGPWTKAGAVKPEDWPHWMRKFKDY